MRDRAEVYADMAEERAADVRRLEPELRGARTLRDAAIRSAVQHGKSQRYMAARAGLSMAQVQRICDLSKGKDER